MESFSAFAPGRVELLGNHTDYNSGWVLSAAIDLGITARGERTLDGKIRLQSQGSAGWVEVDASELIAPRAGSEAWANYPLGVVHELRLAGHEVGAFSATFASDLPSGAGLSSSAAQEVATATVGAFGTPMVLHTGPGLAGLAWWWEGADTVPIG